MIKRPLVETLRIEEVPSVGFYYNYKHKKRGAVNNQAYLVVGVGFHTETDEVFVKCRPVYRNAPAYKKSLELGMPCEDVMPLKIWMAKKKTGKKIVERFTKITDEMVIAELLMISRQMYGYL